MVKSFFKSEKDMLPLPSARKVVKTPSLHHLLSVKYEFGKQGLEGKRLRNASYERYGIKMEGFL